MARGARRAVPYVSVVALVGFVAVAGFVVPRLDRSAAPTIDLLGRLDARYRAVTPDDDAWPLYRTVLAGLNEPPPGFSGAFPGTEGWGSWAAWLEAHRALLPVLRDATRRPVFGRPYDSVRLHEGWVAFARATGDEELEAKHAQWLAERHEGPAFMAMASASIPSLLALRHVSQLACVAAREREARGELDAALGHAETAHGLARQVVARATVIEQMIGFALLAMAHEEIDRLLRAHPDAWNETRLEDLAGSDVCRLELRSAQEGFEAESDFQLDVIQTIFTDDGEGDGVLRLGATRRTLFDGSDGLVETLYHGARLLLHAGRRATVERLERRRDEAFAAMAADPLRKLEPRPVEGVFARVRYALVDVFDPTMVVSALARQLAVARVRRDRTAANVAALRFRAASGAWPETAGALVPRFLATLPADVTPGRVLEFHPSVDGAAPVWMSEVCGLAED